MILADHGLDRKFNRSIASFRLRGRRGATDLFFPNIARLLDTQAARSPSPCFQLLTRSSHAIFRHEFSLLFPSCTRMQHYRNCPSVSHCHRRYWSGRADLNRGPPAPKAGALPRQTKRCNIGSASISALARRRFARSVDDCMSISLRNPPMLPSELRLSSGPSCLGTRWARCQRCCRTA
jgi:hypothetical protein